MAQKFATAFGRIQGKYATKYVGKLHSARQARSPGYLRYTSGVVSTKNFELKVYPGFRVLVLKEN